MIGNEGNKFTIRSKRKQSKPDDIPGPGAYNTETNFFKGPSFSIYGADNQPSGLLANDKDIPAPGTYDVNDKLVLSSAPKFSFGNGHEILLKENIPGPGAYDTSYADKKFKPPGVKMAGKIETKYETDSPGP